jgi:uncharacterized protein YegJ (DUF2314 family)
MPSARVTALLVAASVVCVALCSCSRGPDKGLVPAGSLMADSIRFQYAVYLLPVPPHSVDPAAALREALVDSSNELKLVDEIPRDPRAALIHTRIQKNVPKEYPPPDLKSLQYLGHGVSPEQAQALQKSSEAFIPEFAHPKDRVWTALRTANTLVEEIARKTGGLVWDEETREVFSPDAWHKKRLASWKTDVPDVPSETVVQIYQKDEYVRAITLGMAKLGLPDVVIEDSSWSSNNQAGNLINLFCQSLAEGKTVRKAGTFRLELRAIRNSTVRDDQMNSLKSNASGIACLTLKQGKWEAGDPKNRLIQLTSDTYPGSDLHVRQETMLSSFFGSEDSVTTVQHNEELLAASAKAKTKLPEMQKAFARGLEPGEFIDVKAPFGTPDGGTEWMWVEVTSWKNNEIKGLLQNDPSNVPNLHSGQVVDVRQEEVFDYIRQYADKQTEGNTTGDIIRKMDEDHHRTANSSVPPAVTPCGVTD